MSIIVRPAHADELARAEELVMHSINDLTVRHGFGPIATLRTPDFQAFCLRDDPQGVWLAEDDGEIAGFALSESLALRASGSTLRTTAIRATAADFEMLRRLDLATLGVSREKHHRYLLDNPTMAGVFLEEAGGECVGYAYVAAAGHVGPLAVMHADAMPAAFRTALAIAVAGKAPRISVFIPGPSDALAIAAGVGMRFTLPMVLMSARDYGDWTRYLPRNPGFM